MSGWNRYRVWKPLILKATLADMNPNAHTAWRRPGEPPLPHWHDQTAITAAELALDPQREPFPTPRREPPGGRSWPVRTFFDMVRFAES